MADLRLRMRLGLVLTRGERLRLRRRQNRLTQLEAAALYGVGRDKYRDWEADFADDAPVVSDLRAADLQLHELCAVHRRRKGITLQQIARVLDRSVVWVHNAERGGPGAALVVDYLLEHEG